VKFLCSYQALVNVAKLKFKNIKERRGIEMKTIKDKNENSSSVNHRCKDELSMGRYIDQELAEIPEDKKNIFIQVGNVLVNCCIGDTRVSMDDFVSDLCKLELRI
jgi:hypothetical protein